MTTEGLLYRGFQHANRTLQTSDCTCTPLSRTKLSNLFIYLFIQWKFLLFCIVLSTIWIYIFFHLAALIHDFNFSCTVSWLDDWKSDSSKPSNPAIWPEYRYDTNDHSFICSLRSLCPLFLMVIILWDYTLKNFRLKSYQPRLKSISLVS